MAFEWTTAYAHTGDVDVTVSTDFHTSFAVISQVAVTLRVLRCDEMPDTIGQCVALRTLIVKSETLLSLPSSIGQMVGLSDLHLVNCFELTSLPDALGQLESLRATVISDCRRLTCLPESLGQLHALTSLHVLRCHALTCLPNIDRLHALEHLVISSCRVLCAIPDLPPMQRLKKIRIGMCHIAALPPSLFAQPSLEVLRVSCSPVMRVPDIIDLPAIKDLFLESLSQAQIPSAIGQLTTLTDFTLSGNTVQFVPDLHRLTQLLRLSINCGALRQLPDLNSLTTLQHVRLRIAQQIVDMRLPNLTVLLVSGPVRCKLQAPRLATAVAVNVSLDLFLDFGNTPVLHDLKVSGLRGTSFPDVSQLQGLVLVSICFCNKLRMLPEALGRLPRLEKLSVLDCGDLASLPESLGYSHTLEHVRVSSCRNFLAMPVSCGQSDVAIDIHRCRAIQCPPLDVCGKGRDAISIFLQREFLLSKILLLVLLGHHLPDELWCFFQSIYS